MLFQPMQTRWRRHRLAPLVLLSLMLFLAACGSTTTTSSTTTPAANVTPTPACPSTTSLTGAGSTFDNPLFSKMFDAYKNLGCKVKVNYQSVGSGAGINDLITNIVAFGATDAPLTDTQLQQSAHGPIIHIPVTIGAEAMAYNITGIDSQKLKLTGPVIADIFLGKITSWDDPTIKQLNTDLTLPHQTITVVHRSDGSGTTGIFTHYLSAISPEWKTKVGAANTVSWPTGVGGKGNAGVASAVKSTTGSIGYVELAYVVANNIPYAQVQNKDGVFLVPSLDGTKAAAANVTTIPADLRFFIVNAPGKDSYPIVGYSWVIVYQTQQNADRGQALANLLWWMTHDGQQYSAPLVYAPLPDTIVTKDEAQIKSMKCGSSACYTG